jgi:signal transduction histidine kinase/HAMP domain-containing protein/CheY-like chemotaxis protein
LSGLTEREDTMEDALLIELTDALRRVQRGDFKVRLDRRSGSEGSVVDAFNEVVSRQERQANDLSRISRLVGREGRLTERLTDEGYDGSWAEGVRTVNALIDDLGRPTTEIARVIAAVAEGDLSQHMANEIEGRPLRGEFLQIGRTVNTMVDQLSSFADEVTRVARDVGTEGKLGGQADVRGVSGTWRDLTANVNLMAANLTNQVRSISQVTTAIAHGDLSQKITVSARGEVAELTDTINSLTDTLRVFAEQVTRVAREVGTEGKLGGQAEVPNVGGTWKDLTDNVNSMASNLTSQVRNIAQVATAVAEGDLSQKITVAAQGEILELKSTVNTMVDQLSSFANEVTRVAREVGTEGKLGGQALVPGVGGTWKDLTENVNLLAGNLTTQVRNIAQVTTAVAKGDLSQKITVDVRGEILELKSTVNTMVDQLSSFADEVTRVAREVGTEGKLGGQAQVRGVAGTWRDLTDNVNSMASNLTAQVRNIAQVTTAVARGDLSQKITVDAQGEILELKSTVNTMVDQLSSFADEVTRVAREVGTEGKLGGQAQVQGVAGTWRDLTENVNQLASTLTTQLRAIAEVSTAVTRGDMTQRIAVEAMGEVADLKNNINQMIVTLRDTTKKNAEQGWLDSNLARIGGLMQSQRDLNEVCHMIMTEVTPLVNAQLGAFFLASVEDRPMLTLRASYAQLGADERLSFAIGEGLIGQAGASKRRIRVTPDPDAAGTARLSVRSGLADTAPADLVVLPVLFEGDLLGVIEFGSVNRFSDLHMQFLDRLGAALGVSLNTILANRRTEELLRESQRLALEMQQQSDEMQRTNAELEEKAALLSEQNVNIESKNREIELARLGLEEKAQQLTAASQYKSEFLANMSHELRTPLNSLLLLARMLADNAEANLTPKQINFARTIHGAGSDLLALIDDILDLSKIEAGRMDIEPADIAFDDIRSYVHQAFGPQAEEKGLAFTVALGDRLPVAMYSDPQRVQQILRNLLANAVKFTASGSVTLAIDLVAGTPIPPGSDAAVPMVAFSVADTGIGIAEDKLALVFEAFQQADGTTSRRYGGTGLGLSISLELARVLGGAISVESRTDEGSTFTFTVPVHYAAGTPIERPGTDRPADPLDALDPRPNTAVAAIEPPRSAPSILRASSQRVDTDTSALLAGVTVLIVDDDVRNVFALTSVLELHGMEVRYADNGADGVRVLTEESGVDIVLMDAMMPEQDGYETTRAIRRNPTFADLPVVFLTAKAMPGDRESALAAGASDYITKPVDLDELLAMMARWVGVRELAR